MKLKHAYFDYLSVFAFLRFNSLQGISINYEEDHVGCTLTETYGSLS